MRLRYYDKHGAEIQVGMLLLTLGFEASASEIYPLSEFNLREWEIAAE